MKKYLFILVLTIFSNSLFAQDTKIKMYISANAICDKSILTDVSSKLISFQENAAIKLATTYPCASVKTDYEVSLALQEFRTQQLIGTDNEEIFKKYVSGLGCDYLINLKFTVKESTAIISAFCADLKIARTLSRASITLPYNNIPISAYESVIKELIDGLNTYEICPFKGDINVKIVSTKKDNQTEEYPVYCNGTDGMYSKITTIDNYSENEWSLQKVKLNASDGNANYALSEEFKIEENNWCFDCGSNKQGPRTYSEKTTTYADIKGLLIESEFYGVKTPDGRAYLTFLDNGTYTLRVTAASTQGEKKTIKEVTAQGVCKNINEKPKTIKNNIDIGLNETFGPFTGNALDKTLSHKDTIKRTDPISNEETTITYEFNLTRD